MTNEELEHFRNCEAREWIRRFNKKKLTIGSSKASYVAGVGTKVIGQNTVDIAKAEAKIQAINAYETLNQVKNEAAHGIIADLDMSL